jgi:hypothetical protein
MAAGMPSKRTFDLVVVVTLLVSVAWGLPNMWAARKLADPNTSDVVDNVAGAVSLAS